VPTLRGGVHGGLQAVLLPAVVPAVRGGRGEPRDVPGAAAVLRLLRQLAHGVHRRPHALGEAAGRTRERLRMTFACLLFFLLFCYEV
jgi:hypothetical protein